MGDGAVERGAGVLLLQQCWSWSEGRLASVPQTPSKRTFMLLLARTFSTPVICVS